MTNEEQTAAASDVRQTAANFDRPPSVWPAVVMVAAFWTFLWGTDWLELPIFVNFFSRLIATALLFLSFGLWWLLGKSYRGERLVGLVAAFGGGIVGWLVADHSAGPMGWLLITPPWVITVWTAWLVVARFTRMRQNARRIGLAAAILATFGAFLLVRTNGLDGQGHMAFRWRFGVTDEQLSMAERAARLAGTKPVTATLVKPLALQDGDWPGFRGANRDDEVRGERIATDWNAAPPKQVWRQRIGPAWSSIAIVDGRLFTQEQRGDSEAVVCLDAATGREVWSHEDAARFSDGQAGAGPRATPTFVDGRLYTLGGTGVLDCLDAATGELKWTHDIAKDADAPAPMWGFSSSPLVADGLVVVFAGGGKGNGLLAYRADSGEPDWTAVAGQNSYSSPQIASFGGESQILLLTDQGVTAVQPKTGKVRWEHAAPKPGMWRAVQPRQIGETQVIFGSEDLGLMLVDLAGDPKAWTASKRWLSQGLKPAYNDFVLCDGAVYGFDGPLFSCVDLATGKRKWKAGRYGHGQVLFLADQKLLLVTSETGEAVLIKANPDKHEELGRFQAVNGKTWNHPTIAHGRLYVRNDEEIACYELKPPER